MTDKCKQVKRPWWNAGGAMPSAVWQDGKWLSSGQIVEMADAQIISHRDGPYVNRANPGVHDAVRGDVEDAS